MIPLIELLETERRWWGEGELVAYYGDTDPEMIVAELQRLEALGQVSQARPLTVFDPPQWGIDVRGVS